MQLIVALGNPGAKYAHTRHNIGFAVADELVEKIHDPSLGDPWKFSKKGNTDYAWFELKNQKIEVIKPQTYMNKSGQALAYTLKKHHDVDQVFLLHDDVDLDLGRLKIQAGGGPAGHHGVESIKDHVSNNKYHVTWKDVVRFRLGIGRPPNETTKQRNNDTSDHVLSKFTRDEQPTVQGLISTAVTALQVALENGPELAMNQFNNKN